MIYLLDAICLTGEVELTRCLTKMEGKLTYAELIKRNKKEKMDLPF